MGGPLIKNIEEWAQQEANIRIVELFVLESNRIGGIEAPEMDEVASAAINLLARAGLEPTSKDSIGKPIEDEVQTILMILLMRCPQLRELFTGRNLWGKGDVPF